MHSVCMNPCDLNSIHVVKPGFCWIFSVLAAPKEVERGGGSGIISSMANYQLQVENTALQRQNSDWKARVERAEQEVDTKKLIISELK